MVNPVKELHNYGKTLGVEERIEVDYGNLAEFTASTSAIFQRVTSHENSQRNGRTMTSHVLTSPAPTPTPSAALSTQLSGQVSEVPSDLPSDPIVATDISPSAFESPMVSLKVPHKSIYNPDESFSFFVDFTLNEVSLIVLEEALDAMEKEIGSCLIVESNPNPDPNPYNNPDANPDPNSIPEEDQCVVIPILNLNKENSLRGLGKQVRSFRSLTLTLTLTLTRTLTRTLTLEP
jgi:hypothetical protein